MRMRLPLKMYEYSLKVPPIAVDYPWKIAEGRRTLYAGACGCLSKDRMLVSVSPRINIRTTCSSNYKTFGRCRRATTTCYFVTLITNPTLNTW